MKYDYYVIITFIILYLSCTLKDQSFTLPTEETIKELAATAADANLNPSHFNDSLALKIHLVVNAYESTQPGQFDSLLAAACHNVGGALVSLNKNEAARPFFEEALRLRRRFYHGDVKQKDILRAYCMIGVTYFASEKFDARKALSYLVDSTRLCPWNRSTAIPHIFALSETGQVYLSINELTAAKNSFLAAYDSISAYNVTLPKSLHAELFKFYTSCARQQEDFGLALRLSKEGKPVDQEDTIKLADYEMIAGNIWQDSMNHCKTLSLQMEARANSLAHITKALTIYKSVSTQDGKENAIRTVSNLGALYYRSKKYKQAVDLLSNALNDTIFKGLSLQEFAPIHINLGDALCSMSETEEGIAQYHDAITSLIPSGKQGVLTDFEIEDWPDLLYTYGAIAKAQLVRYKNHPGSEVLPKVMDAYNTFVQLTNLIRSERLTEGTKFDLAKKSQEALLNAMGVCFQLYQITKNEDYKAKAFSFAEQSKGFALVEAVRLRQLGEANPDQKLRQKSALSETLVSDFQKGLLDKDQGLLSYFVQDTVLNIFLIKTDEMIWQQTIMPKDSLNSWAGRFQYLLQNAEKDQESKQIGYLLYELLLAPVKGSLPPRLVIVPCAPFLGLPFEALPEQPDAGRPEKQAIDTNFVLFHHATSYSVSANIWAEMQKAPHAAGLLNQVAAFIPSFSLSGDHSDLASILAPMQNTRLEVERINQKVPVLSFKDTSATKSSFLDASRRYNILHIASHSICDDRNPDKSLLAFNQPGPMLDTSQLLYLRELYGLDLHQDLIVLSACETSRGEFALGEGNLSIARGLAYAGAHSFVSTLWVINTEPGTVIMPAFYEFLKQGLPKDIALAKAKRAYFEGGTNTKAPLKWAGFVLNGSTQPIAFSGSGACCYWPWLLGALLAFIVFLWARRRAQRK